MITWYMIHIELSSSSAIVQGVVVGKVSPALLTSWHVNVLCAIAQPEP